MKLTDIDLSSLAEVAAAIALLDSVHVRLATGGVPLPSLPPAEFVVNPSPTLPNPLLSNPTADPEKLWGLGTKAADAALAADAEKLRGLGVDPITAQPLPASGIALINGPSAALTAADFGTDGLRGLDAASVFGGAPAQSAAPLQPAPSTAGAAASPTALAALPASGALPTLQALAPQPGVSAGAQQELAAQASPAGGVEVDADGLPWDGRIHAGTKRRNADGRWTAKKGINDPDLVPRVVAQLRAQMAAGGVTTQSADPLPASTPAPSTTPLAALPMTSGPVSSAAPTQPALPGLQPPAAPTPPTIPGAKPVPLTFQDFMTAMTVEVMSGRVPATALLEACKPYGGTTALAANPAPIPEIWAALKQQYPGML